MSPSLTSISIWHFQPPSPSLIFLCPWGHWRCTYSFSSWPSLTFPALISVLTLFLSQPSSYGHCLQPGPFPAPLFSAFPISRTFNSHLCLKEPLDEGERGEWKAGLKLNIQKMDIMASGPITSWQIEGEKMKTVTDFIFLGSKTTADSGCSHEIKRCLLLEGKAMTNLDSILKSRGVILPTKVYLVKAMVFPVVMYGC